MNFPTASYKGNGAWENTLCGNEGNAPDFARHHAEQSGRRLGQRWESEASPSAPEANHPSEKQEDEGTPFMRTSAKIKTGWPPKAHPVSPLPAKDAINNEFGAMQNIGLRIKLKREGKVVENPPIPALSRAGAARKP